MTLVEIRHPDWLKDKHENSDSALGSAIRSFELSQDGLYPDSIEGWALVTSCMRILRCIYGSDLETAAAIRKLVIKKEERLLSEQAEQPADH